MVLTHAQQFANETLPRSAFRDPLGLARALAGDGAGAALAALWDAAGADLAPSARAPHPALAVRVVRRGLYTTLLVTPPPPRGAGDPALIALVGRGDGASRLSTLGYFVLELAQATGVPRFALASRTSTGERGALWPDGPLPDPSWVEANAYELYSGRSPLTCAGSAELPGWYWWYALDGAGALRAFDAAADDAARFDAVHAAPALLLPELADTAEAFGAPLSARRLRELRPYLLRATSLAPAFRALAERLASAAGPAAIAHAERGLALVAEGAEHGALAPAQAYELEAVVRSQLAALGADAAANAARSAELHAAARAAAAAPRRARGSTPPPIVRGDPAWAALFLDAGDLPRHAAGGHAEVAAADDPTVTAYGGLRAAHGVWTSHARDALAHVVDSRWLFRDASGASAFLRDLAPHLAGGLAPIFAPALGDETLAFGDDAAHVHVLVVRVGRVVARLQVTQGADAAAARQMLHAALLHPLGARIAQRARAGIAAYWLAVASPTYAIAALVDAPGHDAAQLLGQYPLLAHPELPATVAALGETYAPAARALAAFQADLRARQWGQYREAMRALARTLLASEAGDPRVNAAAALEVVGELRQLDADPSWAALAAECWARAT